MTIHLASRLRRLEARQGRAEATLTVVLTYVDPGGTEHTRVRFRYPAGGQPPERSDDGGQTWRLAWAAHGPSRCGRCLWRARAT
jgi:hypothetical protein